MSRYGLATYGLALYGEGTDEGLYDASPIVAYTFPKSYKDEDDDRVVPFLPSDLSPPPVDPDDEDYPDMYWGPSTFSQYLTDFYEQHYGRIFIEPALGSDFYYILLTWTTPAGQWDEMALVKRRYGPPETVDDGMTVMSETGTGRTEYVEVMAQGEIAYYGLFVRKVTGEWVNAGYTEAVNCRNHDGLEEFLKALPRVYTSATGGMLDVIDRRGHLSRMLQGMAFEYDFWKTQADRLSMEPGLMPWASVRAWSRQLGMSELDIITIGDRNLRRWLSAASSYTETKGTQNGIEALSSALTGWPITATLSPNLMLDTDDSSAENGLGRWVETGGVLDRAVIGGSVTSPAASVITNSLPGSPHLQGHVFTFAPSGASASLSLGNDDPVNYGIPVEEGEEYEFNTCWRTTVTTSGNLKADITWYDIRGTSISTTAGTNQAASASWQQTTTTSGTAPAGAAYAGITLSFSSITGSPVYHLDMAQFVVSTTDTTGKFYDARAIDLNIAPIRTNLCTNPSFETNTTGWSAGTQSADGIGYVGALTRISLLLNNTQIGTGVTYSTAVGTVAENDPVTASIYVNPTSGSAAEAVDIPLVIQCKDSGGSVLSTQTDTATVYTGVWPRLSVTITAPASTSYVTVRVAGSGTSAGLTGAGSELLLDGCLIEKSDLLKSYFDGSIYADLGNSRWTGTGHASTSCLYPQRLTRQSTLSRILGSEAPEPVYLRTVLVD